MANQGAAVAEGKRTAELSVDVKASVDAVWKALTDGEELTRWFPAEAKVKPGVGGSIVNSWGEGLTWESPITIWEPRKRLRTLWGPPDVPEAELFGVDFFIEDRGGGVTRLRLVHFGFSKDPQWDQMYDGVSRGWDFMLWGLKTYLEEHPGVPRTVVFVQSELAQGTTKGAWERVFSREGFLPESARSLKPGGKFNATIGGQPVEGIVRVNLPGRDFQAKIDTFDGALLRVQTDPCKGGPGEEISVTIAEYGGDKELLRRMHGAVVDQLGAMFGREKLTDRTKMR